MIVRLIFPLMCTLWRAFCQLQVNKIGLQFVNCHLIKSMALHCSMCFTLVVCHNWLVFSYLWWFLDAHRPRHLFEKEKDKPCKTAKSVLVSVEKNARENFPLLSPFKRVFVAFVSIWTALNISRWNPWVEIWNLSVYRLLPYSWIWPYRSLYGLQRDWAYSWTWEYLPC